MDDPLKPQLNYSEALKYLKEREQSLLAKEKDLANRHQKLIQAQKDLEDSKLKSKQELSELENKKLTIRADIAKLVLATENQKQRLSGEIETHTGEIGQLKQQIASFQASYNLNKGRNEDLAKSIRTKEQELGKVRKELDDLVRYHAAQEKSVQEVLDGYADQLQASTGRLEDMDKQEAVNNDKLSNLRLEVDEMTRLAETHRTRLEDELTAMEQQRDNTQADLAEATNNLDDTLKQLEKARLEQDKTLAETEKLIQKSLTERKVADQSRSLLKRVESDVSDERRRLQSDKAVFGRL